MDIASCPDHALYAHAEAVASASAAVHGLRARLEFARTGHSRDILSLELEAALQKLEAAQIAQGQALRQEERRAVA